MVAKPRAWWNTFSKELLKHCTLARNQLGSLTPCSPLVTGLTVLVLQLPNICEFVLQAMDADYYLFNTKYGELLKNCDVILKYYWVEFISNVLLSLSSKLQIFLRASHIFLPNTISAASSISISCFSMITTYLCFLLTLLVFKQNFLVHETWCLGFQTSCIFSK